MVKPKRIIILGSTGFIGKYLFDKFSESGGIEVIGFSSKDLNLLSMVSLRQKLSNLTQSDILVITSAVTRLRKNDFESMSENIQMAQNIADLIRGKAIRQIIYMSTVDVYGIDIKDGERITEETALSPNDYYAISKLAGEFLLKMACLSRGIPLVILRLAGIYGPGDENKSTIYKIVSGALKSKKICIYGDGKNLRDYVYVGDLYEIIKYALGKRLNLTVNVATGKSHSISEIARIVKSLLPVKVSIEYRQDPFKTSDKRVRDLIFDGANFKKSFRGLKLLDLKDGVRVYLKNRL